MPPEVAVLSLLALPHGYSLNFIFIHSTSSKRKWTFVMMILYHCRFISQYFWSCFTLVDIQDVAVCSDLSQPPNSSNSTVRSLHLIHIYIPVGQFKPNPPMLYLYHLREVIPANSQAGTGQSTCARAVLINYRRNLAIRPACHRFL